MGNFEWNKDLAKKLFAEFTGTAIVLTLGCSIGRYSHTLNAFAWGFAYLAAIQIFAIISGAHLNPAVSGTACIVGVIEWRLMLCYMLAQLLGAMTGIGLSFIVLPSSSSICLSPRAANFDVLGIELFATMFLLFAYCAAWDTRSDGDYGALSLRIGFVFVSLSFATGTSTGCHLNFFRTFVAAAANFEWGMIWPYFAAHALATGGAGVMWRFLFQEEPPEQMT